ncbi:cobalt-precorrin-6A reductase [Oceanirhabdus sp. W0125-5]|uniref:cobalt-precorrin-6A reductase n=1 Tax=Oceanirhabdus sp. W0125-5 TaxID=2999116 RepID=UPI0022F2D371|nr:cobalt-precorrin-6A reductase [Oceanirhabdus sp. W0125-5]WBW96175.1 cobalt-precorrin-6A reductase [Oceanirhabdus sp. W0125-5]
MIGLVLGTSEGREILKRINEFTGDVFVTTATKYGGDILSEYDIKILNTTPLDKKGFMDKIKEHNIEIFLDSTHPYAVEVSKNIIEACNESGITYLRYERESVVERYGDEELVHLVDGYEGLQEVLEKIQGNVLNTTGSRNIKRVVHLNVPNRIIHRVLPTLKVMNEMEEVGIEPHNLIMIKGPVSYQLNKAFYKEYNIECVIMKDSGLAGGTDEKIRSALDLNIPVAVIKKAHMDYPNKFNSIKECVEEIKLRWNNES